jgi:hypothetical protein
VVFEKVESILHCGEKISQNLEAKSSSYDCFSTIQGRLFFTHRGREYFLMRIHPAKATYQTTRAQFENAPVLIHPVNNHERCSCMNLVGIRGTRTNRPITETVLPRDDLGVQESLSGAGCHVLDRRGVIHRFCPLVHARSV